MANPTEHSPQITRVFSALLWTALIALFCINFLSIKILQSKLSQLLLPSLTNPFSIAQHVATAKTLWDAGYQKTATRELVIAADSVESGGSVLGATSNPTTLLTQWELAPTQLKKAYEYWKSETVQTPDYRDGFLIAGAYAVQLGNVNEAKKMFEKAYAIDPNYKPTEEMLLSL